MNEGWLLVALLFATCAHCTQQRGGYAGTHGRRYACSRCEDNILCLVNCLHGGRKLSSFDASSLLLGVLLAAAYVNWMCYCNSTVTKALQSCIYMYISFCAIIRVLVCWFAATGREVLSST